MESIGRLYQREVDRDEPTDLATRDAQLAAITAWGIPDESRLNRLAGITQSTLVANGDNDTMMHTHNSQLLAEHLPNARLRIYPDAGHGFLNQYPELFADDVHAFLEAQLAAATARAPPTTQKESHMSLTTTHNAVVLEPASQAVVEATAKPPFLYELSPVEARAVLDGLQAAPIDKLSVNDRWITVPAGVGDVRVRIVRPRDAVGTLPVILYMHGGGWVLGNAGTHDRLVRELAVGTGAAVVFVEYDRSPEARYPVAIEQGYATAQWIVREGAANQLDSNRIAVAGDSVGGNMTAALTLMAKERGDVRFVHQSMYYPVTDAAMDTGSYEQFAEGYFLTAKMMAWFWDAYEPDVERRLEPFASPLRASDEQLAGLPPAFVIVDEADVLRDEGEAYAARLRVAGTPVTTVRYDGITHDFLMLNALRDTHATRAAIAQAISILRNALNIT